jgi:hypothetical protein
VREKYRSDLYRSSRANIFIRKANAANVQKQENSGGSK